MMKKGFENLRENERQESRKQKKRPEPVLWSGALLIVIQFLRFKGQAVGMSERSYPASAALERKSFSSVTP